MPPIKIDPTIEACVFLDTVCTKLSRFRFLSNDSVTKLDSETRAYLGDAIILFHYCLGKGRFSINSREWLAIRDLLEKGAWTLDGTEYDMLTGHTSLHQNAIEKVNCNESTLEFLYMAIELIKEVLERGRVALPKTTMNDILATLKDLMLFVNDTFICDTDFQRRTRKYTFQTKHRTVKTTLFLRKGGSPSLTDADEQKDKGKSYAAYVDVLGKRKRQETD